MTHTRYRIEEAGEPKKFPPEAMARIEKILKRSTSEAARFLRVRPRDVKTVRAQPRRPPKGGGGVF